MRARGFDIMFGALAEAGDLFGREIANMAGGPSGPELAGRDALARRQHRACGEHGIAFDFTAVHHDSAKTPECAIVERAAVDPREVADQHVIAYFRGIGPTDRKD